MRRMVTAGITSAMKPSRAPSSRSSRVSPACLWPNRKLSPTSTALRAQGLDQNLVHELFRGELRQLGVKGRISTCSMPSCAIRRQRCSGVVISRGERAGATTLGRMRIEGQHGRLPAVLARHFAHAAQNPPMAGMDAVEIADGQSRRPEIRPGLLQTAEDAIAEHLCGSPDGDLQAVVGQPDMRRQAALGRCVRQLVADVREVGAARIELFRVCHGPLDGGVRGVRLIAERIEKQHVEPAQLLAALPAECRCDRSGRRRCRSENRSTGPRPCSSRSGRISRPNRSNGRSVEHVRFQLRNRGLRHVVVENVSERSAGWRPGSLPMRRSGIAPFCRKLNGRTSSSPMM